MGRNSTEYPMANGPSLNGRGVSVIVGVRDGVAVSVGEEVAVNVRVKVGLKRGVRVAVGVRDGRGVRVDVGVLEGQRVSLGLRLAVGQRVDVGRGDQRVSLGRRVTVGQRVLVAARLPAETGAGISAMLVQNMSTPSKPKRTRETRFMASSLASSPAER